MLPGRPPDIVSRHDHNDNIDRRHRPRLLAVLTLPTSIEHQDNRRSGQKPAMNKTCSLRPQISQSLIFNQVNNPRPRRLQNDDDTIDRFLPFTLQRVRAGDLWTDRTRFSELDEEVLLEYIVYRSHLRLRLYLFISPPITCLK